MRKRKKKEKDDRIIGFESSMMLPEYRLERWFSITSSTSESLDGKIIVVAMAVTIPANKRRLALIPLKTFTLPVSYPTNLFRAAG